MSCWRKGSHSMILLASSLNMEMMYSRRYDVLVICHVEFCKGQKSSILSRAPSSTCVLMAHCKFDFFDCLLRIDFFIPLRPQSMKGTSNSYHGNRFFHQSSAAPPELLRASLVPPKLFQVLYKHYFTHTWTLFFDFLTSEGSLVFGILFRGRRATRAGGLSLTTCIKRLM